MNGVINRYALVLNTTVTASSDPIVFLKKVVSEKIGSEAKEIQVHSLRETSVDNIASNHWVRAASRNGGSEEASLAILSDVNTLESEQEKIKELANTDFFAKALKLAKEDASTLIKGQNGKL